MICSEARGTRRFSKLVAGCDDTTLACASGVGVGVRGKLSDTFAIGPETGVVTAALSVRWLAGTANKIHYDCEAL